MDRPLGRLVPTDWRHVGKYPMTAVMDETVDRVERCMLLPDYHWEHDQGFEGACVGWGTSMMMSIMNEQQARSTSTRPFVHQYNCQWLYYEARRIDEWPGEDYDGTSVRAALDVLRKLGHVRRVRKVDRPASIDQGIKENRWATSVDQIRKAISARIPVTIGVNWYADFDAFSLVQKSKQFFIPEELTGRIRGGHCVCLYGASDSKQAFKFKNSWGRDYPLAWMPYKVMERLLREDGEATLVTDI